MPTIDELKMLQALPLDVKIGKTKQRIREWVNYYGEDGVCVSFSGGKDSTVLLHLVRQLYPNVEAVFVNTGLEYPEIQKFAKSFENVTVLRPSMRFDEVISKYGYPLISKNISKLIRSAKEGRKWANNAIRGLDCRDGTPCEFCKDRYQKWQSLLGVDFNISDKCCGVMKEKPLSEYERNKKKTPFVALLAEESERRKQAWLKTGCNAFEAGKSKPLSFWTEQDVLAYIREYDLPIASVYGDVVYDNDGVQYDNLLCDCGCKLKTTGASRTGCIFCGFGAHLEKKGEGRFERLKKTHPRQYEYCLGGGAYDSDGLWKPTKKGLGMKHVFDTLNELYGKDFIRY